MIVFEDHYFYKHNAYDWDYLIDNIYKTKFQLSFEMWDKGNGNYEGYDTYTNQMYWKESLIYKL